MTSQCVTVSHGDGVIAPNVPADSVKNPEDG
jgi:hypothetical protein